MSFLRLNFDLLPWSECILPITKIPLCIEYKHIKTNYHKQFFKEIKLTLKYANILLRQKVLSRLGFSLVLCNLFFFLSSNIMSPTYGRWHRICAHLSTFLTQLQLSSLNYCDLISFTIKFFCILYCSQLVSHVV